MRQDIKSMPINILVLESNERQREQIQEVLLNLGVAMGGQRIAIIFLPTREEVLTQRNLHRFDLIICNVDLDQHLGPAFFLIKAILEQQPDCLVICFNDYESLPECGAEAYEAGAREYFCKPWTRNWKGFLAEQAEIFITMILHHRQKAN